LVEVLAVGSPERGGRHLQFAALEGLDVLHAALAVAALAHDDRPVMVLQAGGDDLAAAGAAAVDQANHREIEVAAVVLAGIRLLPTDARLDGYDQAIVDVEVGNLD